MDQLHQGALSPNAGVPLDGPLSEIPSSPNEHGQVNITEAKAAFAELEHRLSIATHNSENGMSIMDPEKGEPDHFDLREYMQSTNDANSANGISHKHVGVTWSSLSVVVAGFENQKIVVTTFGKAVLQFFLFPYFWFMGLWHAVHTKTQGSSRKILDDFNGVLKPGEMCLVLGRPGSGCSTFLKSIANHRKDYLQVEGDVLYAGITADEMERLYGGEVVYNQEADIHMPTLTVEQTLMFALSLKTPGKRLPEQRKKQFNQQILDTYLKMFNMENTRHTLVGNEHVRGVSGGERKRVSLAETMATRAHVASWDNSTRGLDASTALDFTRSLRVITDIFGQTTFVSLYQAGESIYELFDKVLVIDQGRQVFFGSAKEARQYFIDLGFQDFPRQTTADYLTGCTDPNERKYQPERSAEDVPSTPVALAEAFKSSKHYTRLQADREEYNKLMETEKHDQDAFRKAVAEDKNKYVSRNSPYTVSFWKQVAVLTGRQFRLQSQDHFDLVTSFGMSIILGVVIGVTFINQPNTTAGGFTRGSVIFLAMLLNCFNAFVELPLMMLGRPVLYKHTDFKFFRPSALPLANTLADIPFSFSRILIFNIIIYLQVYIPTLIPIAAKRPFASLTNLSRSAGAFFTFQMFIYLSFLVMQGFFRLLGILCNNFDQAFRLGSFFIPNMILYAGYIIPVFRLQRWLFWIYYINPLSYGFSALMENEFSRIELECSGSYITPRNGPGVTKYPDSLGPNQACTFFGATPGETVISGAAYISQAYAYDVANTYKVNVPALLGFFIFFILAQIVTLEVLHHTTGGQGVIIYAPETEETRALEENRKSKSKGDKESPSNFGHVKNSRKPFTWEKLNYTVPIQGGGSLKLLDDVYGYVKPGTLTALMGASGAGKTTCLDVLAQRKNIGVITGDILVAGKPLPGDFARSTAYAEQLDVHEGTATVREAMQFSAYLRQPAHVSKAEKDAYVEEMIELLELQSLGDALIFTLSVEARKRLTIGVELASKPALLLFLDEPTSGLDSQSAWNLVRFLRKLADAGQAILCTIHQPSALLFESFDRLLLLERGGRTVYFGDIGPDSSVVRSYLAQRGANCPPNLNVAEYMLEAIGAGVTARIGSQDWGDLWTESTEFAEIKKEIVRLREEGLKNNPTEEVERGAAYAAPFWFQVMTVTKRSLLALWRSPDYIFTRLFVHVFIALFTSLTLLQLGNSVRDLQYRIFGTFMVSVLPAIIMGQISPIFILNRLTFNREASSGIYSPYVFAISQLASEIPYNVICGTLFWVLLVWPMGLGQGALGTNANGYQFLMAAQFPDLVSQIQLVELFGVSLGQATSAISPSIKIASLWNPFLSIVLTTFSGVTAPYPTIPTFFRWLYQLSPYTRVVSGMIVTEARGLIIKCRSDEFAVFNPPAGQTCLTWAGEFVSVYGGYLDNPEDTLNCRYCQYKVGDEFYVPLGMEFSNRWRDLFLVLAFFGFNVAITIVASRFLRFAKR